MASEFDLIRKYFTYPTKHTLLGVGDDAALLRVSDGVELAVSTDMLVSGRHFFPDADPQKLGHKALAVNLSDMAAMGATPRWVTLSISLPEADETWIEAFMRGFMGLASEFDVDLVGGDTTRGPLNICVQLMGEVPKGAALRRDGAKAGDLIWVSGQLGDAALALFHFLHRIELEPGALISCLPALHTPAPRVDLGVRLRGIATSAIDISDGLVADLGHITERSKLSAVIEFDRIPKSGALTEKIANPIVVQALLAGGDDYELCFTTPEANLAAVMGISKKTGVTLTSIGRCESGSGVTVRDQRGNPMTLTEAGFDHFAN